MEETNSQSTPIVSPDAAVDGPEDFEWTSADEHKFVEYLESLSPEERPLDCEVVPAFHCFFQTRKKTWAEAKEMHKATKRDRN